MEWSNLNEQLNRNIVPLSQMIEDFFPPDADESGTSPANQNAEISLNFTRTSREGPHSSDRKSPSQKSESENSRSQMNCLPSQNLFDSDSFFSEAEKELNQFDSWIQSRIEMPECSLHSSNASHTTIDSFIEKNDVGSFLKTNSDREKESQQLKATLVKRIHEFAEKTSLLRLTLCEKCPLYQQQLKEMKISQIPKYAQKINALERNNDELKETLEKQSFKQEYSLREKSDRISELEEQLGQVETLYEDIQQRLKEKTEQVERESLEKSSYYYRNKSLENRLSELQRLERSADVNKNTNSHIHSSGYSCGNGYSSTNSHSSHLPSQSSATKNSTSLTDFSSKEMGTSTATGTGMGLPTNSMLSIHTNQFLEGPSVEDYVFWFQKIKGVFLEQYKKEEKEHLSRIHMEKEKVATDLKDVIKEFKKGHVRYELARSCKTISDYIKKNRENFLEMTQDISKASREKSLFYLERSNTMNHAVEKNAKLMEEYEEEIKKQQKISAGLETEISNLNSQLSVLKRNLVAQKKSQKAALQEKEQQLEAQSQLLDKARRELDDSKREAQKLSSQIRKLQETGQHHELVAKELDYSLYYQRREKIKHFNRRLAVCCEAAGGDSSCPHINLRTVCILKPKSETEKHLPSVVKQISDKRIHVEKLDTLTEQSVPSSGIWSFDHIVHGFDGVTQNGQIRQKLKMMVEGCFYSGIDSVVAFNQKICTPQFGESGLEIEADFPVLTDSLLQECLAEEIFRMKQSEKKFLQTQMSVQMIKLCEDRIVDLLDFQGANRRISIKNDNGKPYLSNCNIFSVEKVEDLKRIIADGHQQTFSSDLGHRLILIKFIHTDRRTKDQHESHMCFLDMNCFDANASKNSRVENQLQRDIVCLTALLNTFASHKAADCGQPLENNRLSCLLSQSLKKKNTQVLSLISVGPTETEKNISVQLLENSAAIKRTTSVDAQNKSLPTSNDRFPEQKKARNNVSILEGFRQRNLQNSSKRSRSNHSSFCF